MKRIALILILTLTSTSALAEITPLDVIESWRTVYAGQGAVITFDTAAASGKVMQLNNVTSVQIMSGVTTTSRLEWIRLQQIEDGSVRITMSPEGEMVDSAHGAPITSITFDLSSLTTLATGFPGDIRYTYSAPKITIREDSGNEDSGVRRALTVTNMTGEATSRVEVTESGPRVADFGEFRFESFEASGEEWAIASTPNKVDIFAQNGEWNYRLDVPLTEIPDSPAVLEDFPPRVDMEFEMRIGMLQATIEQDQAPSPGSISFNFDNSAVKVAISRNRFSTGFSSRNVQIDIFNPALRSPTYSVGIGAIELNWAMPFRKSDIPAPYSLAFQLNGMTLGETIWAETDPEDSLGRPTANLSASISGLMALSAGMFDDVSVEMPFQFTEAALERFSFTVGDAALLGSGNLRFNNRRTDPNTGLPEAKGALDFTISGALGFLDRFGRISGVDPMMLLGAKGGLGMFASPTDAPDSFTSKVEFLTGGGIVVNGQTVR